MSDVVSDLDLYFYSTSAETVPVFPFAINLVLAQLAVIAHLDGWEKVMWLWKVKFHKRNFSTPFQFYRRAITATFTVPHHTSTKDIRSDAG